MGRERQHVQAPIHPLMANRWSTRAFDVRAVETEKLAACLEAARWAPSCYNDQPWRLLVADRYHNHEAWQDLFDCLASGNQAWAQRAPVLLLACASGRFGHNGQPNRWGQYDAGQAMMALCLQATALGLVTHQMGGFDPEAARGKFEIPEDFSLMSVTALGYPGDPSVLEDEELRGRELSPRQRKPLEEVAWAGCFGQSFEPPAHAAWEARYQETPSEALPWYHPELDPDVAAALERLEVTGGRVLDLGTGPGTQAVALAKRGFQVVATDVSATALTGAAELARREGGRVHFVRDDILTTALDEMFDLIVDRGIFHIFPPEAHADYLESLDKLLEPGGYLLLKCFSHLETRPEGPPGRYSPEDIKRIFGYRFEVLDVRDSAFRRPDDNQPPKALFCVLRKRE
ncbi:MAG: nitroreductase family protein [Methylohalobius sp. ZOD2]